MPHISTEALIGGALLIVLAVGYQYLPKQNSDTKSKVNKKKNKKKGKGNVQDDEPIPKVEDAGAKVKGKRKGGSEVGKSGGGGASEIREQVQVPLPQPSAALETGPSKVSKPKTLAEKIAPKPIKTKVDDMLAPEDLPAKHARVLKVVNPATSSSTPATAHTEQVRVPLPPPPPEQKIAKFEDDYTSSDEGTTSGTGTGADVQEEDDGWNVVTSRPKKPVSLLLSQTVASSSTSQPLPVSTKIQRKNAKKAEEKKAARAAEEADRLRRLAMHKKDLERAKINEIYSQKKKGDKVTAAKGATASVDANGKLIWE